jgi:hypothetical protein
LLVQNKVAKQKDTPYRLFPVLIQKVGRCGTRPNKPHKPWLVAELRQSSLKTSQLFKSSQARQQGIKNPLSTAVILSVMNNPVLGRVGKKGLFAHQTNGYHRCGVQASHLHPYAC